MTLASTTYVGAGFAVNFRPALLPRGGLSPEDYRRLLDGALSFSLPLLAILLSHEMGHYLMCRRYRIDASPPYFIPFPSLVGTMGAFIRIRDPIRNKRHLFDMGVAGPIAGFVVALPFLAYGIVQSRPNLSPGVVPGTILFNYPLAVTGLQKLLLGRTFTSVDTIEHPAFLAGWFGLFVTALNLLPLGQLDGGHALYAVLGRHHRKAAIPLVLALAALGFKWPGWWVWAALLVFVIGLKHPPVLDEEIPLDPARLLVAFVVFLILVVCFMPVPLEML